MWVGLTLTLHIINLAYKYNSFRKILVRKLFNFMFTLFLSVLIKACCVCVINKKNGIKI